MLPSDPRPLAPDAEAVDDDAQEHGDPVRGLGVALTLSFGFWVAVVLVVTLIWSLP